MKNKKNLLLLSLALVLVGCGGGSGDSSSNPTSSEPTSIETSSSEETSSENKDSNFDIFKNTYNAIGKNYFAYDYLFSLYENEDGSVEPSPAMNNVVVTDKGMLNMATRSGFALGDNGTAAYRFGIDLDAEEIDQEKMFLPSYKPATFYYYGFNASEPSLVTLNEGWHRYLNEVPSSSEIQEMSDDVYSSLGYTKLTKFDNMFTEGKDAEGNITFETSNIVIAMQMLEYFSFGRMEGYSDMYNSDVYNYFYYTLMEYGETGFNTYFTLIEDVGFYYLDIQVYLGYFSEEFPYIERTIVPLSVLPEYEVEQYDLFSYIVPEDFYTTGPGEEPQESVEARALFKKQMEQLIDCNYTINFSGSSEIFQGAKYTGKYISETCFQSSGTGFCYSYYYVPVNESQPDASKGGIYGYEESTGVSEEFEMLSTGGYVESLIQELESVGAPYELADDGVTITYTYDGQAQTRNISEFVESLYYETFGYMYYLSDELNDEYKAYYEGKNYWEVMYGSDWIDQFYYNERTGTFLLSNYYLKAAFFGCCVLYINMNESLAIDFLPGTTEDELPMTTTDYYYGMTYDFGVATFSDVGTTKASNAFGTFVNEKYGFNYPVEEAAA